MDEINFVSAVCISQVDHEDKKGAVDFGEVNLFPSTHVTHNESDAWRRGNWSSVHIAKTTHTGTDGLLFDLQTEHPISFLPSKWPEMVVPAIHLLVLGGRKLDHCVAGVCGQLSYTLRIQW